MPRFALSNLFSPNDNPNPALHSKTDIFELYVTVPIKEEQERKRLEELERIRKEQEEIRRKQEEERKKKEDEDRKIREEEERKKREEQLREIRLRRNQSSGPMDRINMDDAQVDGVLQELKQDDKEVVWRWVRNIRDKGAISLFMMNELANVALWKLPPSDWLVNQALVRRQFDKREQGGFGKGRRPNYRNKDYKYEKRTNTYNDKKFNEKEKGGFVRKELTEDEKKMKDEASFLQNKLKERNMLSSQTELDIKMITNKITPSN